MDVLLTANTGLIGLSLAVFIAGVIFLVFRMTPPPNYEELYRRQREQLYAEEPTKQKKKEKHSKKKDKRGDKKDSHSDQQTSKQHHHHHGDHVDFSEKKDVKVVELDQPPLVEPEKVLASSRQPAKPILVNNAESVKKESLAVNDINQIDDAGETKFVRSNSFKDIKPKDEVELHHKKQNASPAKSPKTVAPTAMVAPMAKSQEQEVVPVETAPKAAAAVAATSAAAAVAATAAAVPSKKKETIKSGDSIDKRSAHVNEKKERKMFSKKDFRELLNQIEHQQLPSDVGDEIIQRLVDALLNHQNESKEWKSTRQDPMQIIKKSLADKEEQVAQLKLQLDNALARSKELHQESLVHKARCSQIESNLAQSEARLKTEVQRVLTDAQREQQVIERELRELREFKEHTHSKLAQLENTNKDLQITLRKAEERVVAEKHSADKAISSRMEKVTLEVEDLKRQLEKAKKSAESSEAERQNAEQRFKQAEIECARLSELLSENQSNLEAVKQELQGATKNVSSESDRFEKEIAKLQEEIQQQKGRNEQLHQKNWSAVQGMNEAEKKFADLQQKILSDEVKLRKTLADALPKPAAAELTSAEGDEFISKFVQQLKLQLKEVERLKADVANLQTSLEQAKQLAENLTEQAAKVQAVNEAEEDSANDELQEELDQLREEAVRLRGENVHYSSVLKETEGMLKDLQEAVEREEKRWEEERTRLEAEKSEMSLAKSSLESKLREHQTQLEEVVLEKKSTIGQLEDTKAVVDDLTKKLALVQQSAEAVVEPDHQQNGHQSEESASPTPPQPQNGGQHEGDEQGEEEEVGGNEQADKKNKKKKNKKKAKKVS